MPDRSEALVRQEGVWIRSAALGRTLGNLWSWAFLIALIVLFSATARGFFTLFNFQNITVTASETLLMALGETFVIISGGIDLSVGATLGLAGMVAALAMKGAWSLQGSEPVAIAIGVLAGLLTGALIGLANGSIIAKLKVPPFIVTLGMLGIARGVTLIISDGTTVIGLPPSLGTLGNSVWFSVLPISVAVTALLVVVCQFLLAKTLPGRYTYAMGGSAEATLRAGVHVDRYRTWIYTLSGLLSAVSGVLITGRFATGSPIAGTNAELNAIAAVVIGGASLFGGEGTIVGTVIGALIIGVLQDGLVIINVQPFWQLVAVGAVVIIAVLIDETRRKMRR